MIFSSTLSLARAGEAPRDRRGATSDGWSSAYINPIVSRYQAGPLGAEGPLMHEIPVLGGDAERGTLRSDTSQVVRNFGEAVGAIRLPDDRQLGRQVVLPGVHVGQAAAGQRLVDQSVVRLVAEAVGVADRTANEQRFAGRQVVGSERVADAELGHVPVTRELCDHAVAYGLGDDLVERLGLQVQLDADLRRVGLKANHL